MADITVIGGINIDIEGKPDGILKFEDSNPGKISVSYGGVGRNITENVARMGGSVAMISVIGEDHMGYEAKEHLRLLGVDVSRIEVKKHAMSAMYLSILNDKNDMELAISDMDVVKYIFPDVLEKNSDLLSKSKVIALDGNLEKETLEFTASRFSDVPIFFDPVSTPKAKRASEIIGKLSCIKPNIMEAEALSGIAIKNDEDLKKVGNWFIEQGVKMVFITLNKDGVYYKDRHHEGFIRPIEVKINSATGAGDSFSAAILMGMADGLGVRDIAQYGMAAAQITMESSLAVNQDMSKEEIERRIAKCTKTI